MNKEKVWIGNSIQFANKSMGNVVLKMISGKELTVNNILYVLEVSKNLISCLLVNKNGFHMVFELDKVVLYKSIMYVGKGFEISTF